MVILGHSLYTLAPPVIVCPSGITMIAPAFLLQHPLCAAQGASTTVPSRLERSEDGPARGVEMCGADAAELPYSHSTLDATVPDRPRPALLTEMASTWPTPSVVLVSVHGQIDVTNSATMTDDALILAISGHGLVLDLSGVNFCGTEGFSALHRVAVGCARTGTAWSFVPGAAVTRLLRVCDPGHWLPAADTVDAALLTVEDQITVHPGSLRAKRVG